MPKHKTLSLREKIKVIEAYENEKVPPKQLVVRFSCGKTQIYETLKNKDKIRAEWFKGTAGQVKRLNARSTGNEDINNAVWEWFVACRAKGLPLSGPLIQEQALEVAKKLGKNGFKASNGWLESFRNRHNVVWSSVCGEAIDVDLQTVEDWKQKISSLIQSYQVRDVFNCDETGLFFRAIPTRTLAQRKDKCVGGKKAKERVSVLLCANMAGDLEKPLVIGKAANPRSFKGLNRDSLPVQWKNNKKAWMTAAIMEEWLHGFNLKMKNQKRKVLLFLDNAACHPHIELSNVTLIFLPANTTSITQPIDQGVIFNFKCFYRKKVLQHLLAEMNKCASLTELTKTITLRNCIYWVARATKEIRPDTVKKCFAKAGFKESEETDDNEDNLPLQELADLLRRGRQDIDAAALVSFDNDLSTEEGVDRAVELIQDNKAGEADPEDEDDEENNDQEDEMKQTMDDLKIKSYTEALSAVHDIEEFAAFKNCPMLVELMQDATGLIQKAIIQKADKQPTLQEIWHKQESQ